MTDSIDRGKSYPLGPTVCEDGVNFSVYSKNAVAIQLLLFNSMDDSMPARVLRLEPKKHRTYHYWHVFVPDLKAGQVYGYRAIGPFEPKKGLRFDPDKVLLDPYGKAVAVPRRYSRKDASLPGSNTTTAMKSVVADLRSYDWEDDAPLKRPFSKTVIYEMHVRGFTRNPNSGVLPERRGTYAGLIEKIPYLKDLGITAVELLPVFQFDEQDAPLGLKNYWGYCPVSFFAPHAGYSSQPAPLSTLDEFRDMVKALHRAGIEVILDVVYNHSTEGNHLGPTLCFRGLENSAYYMLDQDRERYADFSGTGNTLNANHPIVRRLILDSLHYWVGEMHIDGFRFDLASILSRDESGRPMENPPILWDIESDPQLAGIKLIAEAWDAAGLYQVGSFVGDSWKEWNGRFRDDVRRFLRGDDDTVTNLAARLTGSPDLYGHEEREPEQSINFATCHDGFTLNDLVSYNEKHNDANGEDNQDGHNANLSWNCGVEGPSDDPNIEGLRKRQIKNFLAITLLAVGTPMLLMGDEVRRTQRGNNNAYCQDNETTWFDWSLVRTYPDIHRFATRLIKSRLRQDRASLEEDVSLNQLIRDSQIHWHGASLNQPDWSPWSHSLAASARNVKRGLLFHLILNGYWEPIAFELPQSENGRRISWHRWLDTSLDSPNDVVTWNSAPIVQTKSYLAQPRSVVTLIADIT